MNEETVTLGQREQKRAMVLNQVLAGLVSVGEAAVVLGLSVRQVKRLQATYQCEGRAPLVQGNRGRAAVWARPKAPAAPMVAVAQGPYAGFHQQHLTEMLAEQEGLVLSRAPVRRVVLAAGLATPRPRRSATPRRRRKRMPQSEQLGCQSLRTCTVADTTHCPRPARRLCS